MNEMERVGHGGGEEAREREREEKRERRVRGETEEARGGERGMKGWLVREGRHGVVIGCQCFPVLPTTQQPREIGIAYN